MFIYSLVIYPWLPLDASVVITSTRVIYPSEAENRSIQLKNNDNFPNVIQVWVDKNNPESTPETADGPFLALPAIFKMEANQGQVVRLIYTGDEQPRDRESIFYLNVLQIPPLSKEYVGENQMLVMLKSRMKIFYRPAEIDDNAEDLGGKIDFTVNQVDGGIDVTIKNNSSFYASIVDIKMISDKQEINIPVEMVEPKSYISVNIKNQQFVVKYPINIEFAIINDYGGISKFSYLLKE